MNIDPGPLMKLLVVTPCWGDTWTVASRNQYENGRSNEPSVSDLADGNYYDCSPRNSDDDCDDIVKETTQR